MSTLLLIPRRAFEYSHAPCRLPCPVQMTTVASYTGPRWPWNFSIRPRWPHVATEGYKYTVSVPRGRGGLMCSLENCGPLLLTLIAVLTRDLKHVLRDLLAGPSIIIETPVIKLLLPSH